VSKVEHDIFALVIFFKELIGSQSKLSLAFLSQWILVEKPWSKT
jgi:hypothetical protein